MKGLDPCRILRVHERLPALAVQRDRPAWVAEHGQATGIAVHFAGRKVALVEPDVAAREGQFQSLRRVRQGLFSALARGHVVGKDAGVSMPIEGDGSSAEIDGKAMTVLAAVVGRNMHWLVVSRLFPAARAQRCQARAVPVRVDGGHA
jgi:hypothetical protein